MIFLVVTRFHRLTLFYMQPPFFFCQNKRATCAWTYLVGALLPAPITQNCWASWLASFCTSRMPHNAIGWMGPHFGGICPQSCPSTDSWVVSPKRCYAPQTLNRIAECFQCLPEDTKMRVLSQLLTTGVNLPSADIEAAPGVFPGGFLSRTSSRKSFVHISDTWSQ